ncbi:hypothetical protein [Dyella caseinilytica]|nr:hypothetical protein [Dyella caseinilytica]GFZ97896.1 hypothetical protein GCM10011408_18030 [Dyella caseinilytica]
MAGIGSRASRLSASPQRIAGLQKYFVDVPGTASAHALSVVSFEASEQLGEPYTITLDLTHPDELPCADYLGKNASFTMTPLEGDTRVWHGCVTKLSLLKTTRAAWRPSCRCNPMCTPYRNRSIRPTATPTKHGDVSRPIPTSSARTLLPTRNPIHL